VEQKKLSLKELFSIARVNQSNCCGAEKQTTSCCSADKPENSCCEASKAENKCCQ
jgi:hypothetical protein